MGPALVATDEVRVLTADRQEFAAVPVDVGNPHAVSFCADPAAIDLREAPTWQPEAAFPHGVNAEFVSALGPRHLAMRVYERGSGETRSCGTGTVAAAAAWHHRHHPGRPAADPAPDGGVRYRVDVPGGTVEVELGEQTFLTGPAVIVARGQLIDPGGSGRPGRRGLTPTRSGNGSPTVGGTCDSCPTMSLPESEYLPASAHGRRRR